MKSENLKKLTIPITKYIYLKPARLRSPILHICTRKCEIGTLNFTFYTVRTTILSGEEIKECAESGNSLIATEIINQLGHGTPQDAFASHGDIVHRGPLLLVFFGNNIRSFLFHHFVRSAFITKY